MNVEIVSISEYAISLVFGTSIHESSYATITHLNHLLYKEPFEGFVETVPSYVSLTVFYQPEKINSGQLLPSIFVSNFLMNLLSNERKFEIPETKTVVVPVCYDEEFGIDLSSLAEEKKMSVQDIISLHSAQEYKVYMMGFLPGFPYMGEVHPKLIAKRKATPRSVVAEGSVGIAGNQTGIYPLDSPGGWQIIGRTPLNLFDLNRQELFYFKTGSHVRFEPITKDKFYELKQEPQTIPEQLHHKPKAVVVKSGVFAVFQDLGRTGYRAFGIPESGAMDLASHHLANALVGNSINEVTIEVTMGGIAIQFFEDTFIAVTGAGKALVDSIAISSNKKQLIKALSVLEIKLTNVGLRTYIAVAGGFETPKILNSSSATPKIQIGSILHKGSKLFYEDTKNVKVNRKIDDINQLNEVIKTIRIIKGVEHAWLEAESKLSLLSEVFHLSNRCDRMGCHLQGKPLQTITNQELLSTAVHKGTIQLTSSGQLIVLMNDCQTTGGYPRIAQVAAIDLAVLAQLRPSDQISFKMITLEEAEKLYLIQQKKYENYFS